MPPIGDDEGGEGYDGDGDDDDQPPHDTSGGAYVEDDQEEYMPNSPNAQMANVTTRRGHRTHVYRTDFVEGSSNAGPIPETNATTPSPNDWPAPSMETPRRIARTMRSQSDLNFSTRSPVRRPNNSHSSANSARSSQSNGVGFMNSYDPAAMQQMEAEGAYMNGTATPELIFAEIGHGAGPGMHQTLRLDSHLPVNEEVPRDGSPLDDWVIQERPDTPVATTLIPSSANRSTTSLQSRRFNRISSSASTSPARASSARSIVEERRQTALAESLHTALDGLAINRGPQHQQNQLGAEDDGRGRRFDSFRSAFVSLGLIPRGDRLETGAAVPPGMHAPTNGTAPTNPVPQWRGPNSPPSASARGGGSRNQR